MPRKNSKPSSRTAKRLAAKIHKKRMKGTHFLRTASWGDIDAQTDKRVYEGPDGPLGEEDGRLMFETLVKMVKTSGTCMAVQLFTRDNRIAAECVGLLNNHYFEDPEKEMRSELVTTHKNFKMIMASIRQSGVGFSFSKDNMRREIRLYDGEPREWLHGLPLRKFRDTKTLEKEAKAAGVPMKLNPDGALAPFVQAGLDKGLSQKEAFEQGMTAFHVSEGRSAGGIKGAHRPRSRCQTCDKRETTDNLMKACAACKMVFYCCRDCQTSDWDNHKSFCKKNRV